MGKGAKLNIQNNLLDTALHVAAHQGEFDILANIDDMKVII